MTSFQSPAEVLHCLSVRCILWNDEKYMTQLFSFTFSSYSTCKNADKNKIRFTSSQEISFNRLHALDTHVRDVMAVVKELDPIVSVQWSLQLFSSFPVNLLTEFWNKRVPSSRGIGRKHGVYPRGSEVREVVSVRKFGQDKNILCGDYLW